MKPHLWIIRHPSNLSYLVCKNEEEFSTEYVPVEELNLALKDIDIGYKQILDLAKERDELREDLKDWENDKNQDEQYINNLIEERNFWKEKATSEDALQFILAKSLREQLCKYLVDVDAVTAKLKVAKTTLEHAYSYLKDFDCGTICDATVNHHEPECCMERDFSNALRVINGEEK